MIVEKYLEWSDNSKPERVQLENFTKCIRAHGIGELEKKSSTRLGDYIVEWNLSLITKSC